MKDSKNKEKLNKSYSNLEELVKIEVLGVTVTNDTKENILEFIINSLQKKTKPYYIVTPNPEMIVLASKNNTFKSILNSAKLALNDGVGVSVAARILGKSLQERFTGVELVENLCKRLNDWPITVGFLGAGPKVAELASECLVRQYPRLKVVFADSEWPEVSSDRKEVSRSKYQVLSKEQQKEKILNTKYVIHNTDVIDILFVAFGVPKQEEWMVQNLGKIPVKVMIGVGGALDYISGKVPRAPKIMRSLGLEWLFRLSVQPWRWKRQIALIEFVGMVIKEKLRI